MNVELKEIEEIIREDCDDNLAYHPATAARRIYNLFKRRQSQEPTEEEPPSEVKRVYMAGVEYGANVYAQRVADAIKSLAIQVSSGKKSQENLIRLAFLDEIIDLIPDDKKVAESVSELYDEVKKELEHRT